MHPSISPPEGFGNKDGLEAFDDLPALPKQDMFVVTSVPIPLLVIAEPFWNPGGSRSPKATGIDFPILLHSFLIHSPKWSSSCLALVLHICSILLLLVILLTLHDHEPITILQDRDV